MKNPARLATAQSAMGLALATWISATGLIATSAAAQCLAFGQDMHVDAGGTDAVVALGDVDGDGVLDLVTGLASPSVSIALGNGAGGFGPPSLFPLQGTGSVSTVQVGDLDGDGDADIAVVGMDIPLQTLANLGAGGFAAPVQAGVALAFPRMTLGDLNGDGSLDLIATTPGIVLFNQGNGTFDPPVSFSAIFGSNVAVGDLNGDEINDLVVTISSSPAHLKVFFGSKSKTLTAGPTLPLPTFALAATIADLDGDGDNDIAAAIFGTDQIAVIRNLGGATFAPAVMFGAGDGPSSITTADLNLDGHLDLLVHNSFSGVSTISVLAGHGDGTFAADMMFGSTPGQPAVGDLDGDGLPDVVFATQGPLTGPAVTLNRTCLTPTPSADLNGDGQINGLDLALLLGQWTG